jgi:hypothetical protein
MTDDIQRQALARSIAVRLQLLSHGDLRIVDDVVIRLCQRASNRRRHVTEAIDDLIDGVEAHLAELDRERAALHDAARAEMVGEVSIGIPGDNASLRPMVFDDPPPRQTLTADARQRLDERRDRAVSEVIAARPDLFNPAREFAADQHLTRVSGTSSTLALADVARDRDEDLEVELEWGVDRDAGEGR